MSATTYVWLSFVTTDAAYMNPLRACVCVCVRERHSRVEVTKGYHLHYDWYSRHGSQVLHCGVETLST